jgi:hypothetical protein
LKGPGHLEAHGETIDLEVEEAVTVIVVAVAVVVSDLTHDFLSAA